jgi:hypothetical protein
MHCRRKGRSAKWIRAIRTFCSAYGRTLVRLALPLVWPARTHSACAAAQHAAAHSADTVSRGLRSKRISRGRKQDTRADCRVRQRCVCSPRWPLQSILNDPETAVTVPVSRLSSTVSVAPATHPVNSGVPRAVVQFGQSKNLWQKHHNPKRKRGNAFGPRSRFLKLRFFDVRNPKRERGLSLCTHSFIPR